MYNHLRVFGSACYPNLFATAPHKLAPRSTLCVFLGYSANHKGYRCLDLSSNHIIISLHVVFDESSFPFASASSPPTPEALEFLDTPTNPVSAPIGPSPFVSCAGSSPAALPRAASGAVPAPAPAGAPLPAVSTSVGVPTSLASSSAGAPLPAPVPTALASPPPVASTSVALDPQAIRYIYSRWSAPTATTVASPVPAPLPKGVVSITPIVNQHPMETHAKIGHRFPVLYHTVALSMCPPSSGALSPIPIGGRLCRRNTMLCFGTILGI